MDRRRIDIMMLAAQHEADRIFQGFEQMFNVRSRMNARRQMEAIMGAMQSAQMPDGEPPMMDDPIVEEEVPDGEVYSQVGG